MKGATDRKKKTQADTAQGAQTIKRAGADQNNLKTGIRGKQRQCSALTSPVSTLCSSGWSFFRTQRSAALCLLCARQRSTGGSAAASGYEGLTIARPRQMGLATAAGRRTGLLCAASRCHSWPKPWLDGGGIARKRRASRQTGGGTRGTRL